jgi:hypothetical protein
MKVSNLIQEIGCNYVAASNHHLAAISEIIDKKSKVHTIAATINAVNSQLLELEKVPGKEIVNSPKYKGTQGDVYLITQQELEGLAHIFNKVSELVPIHHTDSLASMLSNIQCMINEIKKD